MAIAKTRPIGEWGDLGMRVPSVKEMERALGLDRAKSVSATDSDNDGESDSSFAEWYEEELRALYKKLKASSK